MIFYETEDTFTPPSPWCQHPERWHAADNESTELEVSQLIGALVVALQPDLVFETGTAFGETAELIGRALQANGRGRLVTVECNIHRARVAQARCEGLPVEIVVNTSFKMDLPDELIDLAWIDSGPERDKEIRRLQGHLMPGALVAVHDAGPQHQESVGDGLDQLEREGLLKVVRLRTPRGVALCQAVG